MNIALYARVSTRDGDQTCENQLLVLRRWALEQGHRVVAEYIDEAGSTRWTERTGWAELIQAIEITGSPIQCVAFVRLDRAFRSVRDAYNLMSWFQEHGVQVVAVQQPSDRLVDNLGGFCSRCDALAQHYGTLWPDL